MLSALEDSLVVSEPLPPQALSIKHPQTQQIKKAHRTMNGHRILFD